MSTQAGAETGDHGVIVPSPGFQVGRFALRWIPPIIFALAVLGLWQLAIERNVSFLPRRDLPAPTDIANVVVSQLPTAAFWLAIGQTLQGWAFGLALAAIVAIPIGLAIGSSQFLYDGCRAMIDLLRPIPSIAILPLAVLVIGVDLKLKLSLVIIGSFWPLLLQTIYGVQDVDPAAREMGRAYGLGPLRIFFWIVLPGVTPYVFTGLRISAVVALNVSIVVEVVVGSTGGIGSMINQLQIANRIPLMWGYVVVAGILGLLINIGIRRAERTILHWHPSQRRLVPL